MIKDEYCYWQATTHQRLEKVRSNSFVVCGAQQWFCHFHWAPLQYVIFYFLSPACNTVPFLYFTKKLFPAPKE